MKISWFLFFGVISSGFKKLNLQMQSGLDGMYCFGRI